MSTGSPLSKNLNDFKRPNLLYYLLLPQLAVLLFFILTRGSLWLFLAQNFESFSSFSFKLMTSGAEWASVSISTTIVSLSFYFNQQEHYRKITDTYFSVIDAKSMVNSLLSDYRWALFLKIFSVFFFVFVTYSAFNILSTPFDQNIHESNPFKGSIGLCFLSAFIGVFGFLNSFNGESHFNHQEGAANYLRKLVGITSKKTWSVEQTYIWKQALDNPHRINSELAHKVISDHFNGLMGATGYKSDYDQYVAEQVASAATPPSV